MKFNYSTEGTEKGFEYEKFIEKIFNEKNICKLTFYDKKIEQLRGETEEGYEIKFDDNLKITGNLYIEYQEKTHKDNVMYVNSGILKDDNTIYFVIGNYDEVFIFKKEILLELYNSFLFRHVVKDTSKGFLIQRYKAFKLCYRHIYTNTEFEMKDRYDDNEYYVEELLEEYKNK
jgi:hypothetical protein